MSIMEPKGLFVEETTKYSGADFRSFIELTKTGVPAIEKETRYNTEGKINEAIYNARKLVDAANSESGKPEGFLPTRTVIMEGQPKIHPTDLLPDDVVVIKTDIGAYGFVVQATVNVKMNTGSSRIAEGVLISDSNRKITQENMALLSPLSLGPAATENHDTMYPIFLMQALGKKGARIESISQYRPV